MQEQQEQQELQERQERQESEKQPADSEELLSLLEADEEFSGCSSYIRIGQQCRCELSTGHETRSCRLRSRGIELCLKPLAARAAGQCRVVVVQKIASKQLTRHLERLGCRVVSCHLSVMSNFGLDDNLLYNDKITLSMQQKKDYGNSAPYNCLRTATGHIEVIDLFTLDIDRVGLQAAREVLLETREDVSRHWIAPLVTRIRQMYIKLNFGDDPSTDSEGKQKLSGYIDILRSFRMANFTLVSSSDHSPCEKLADHDCLSTSYDTVWINKQLM